MLSIILPLPLGGPFDNRQYLAINGMGTLNILECVREFNPNIHRLVYACTEAIYWELTEKGRLFNKLITEDMVAKYHHMPYFLTKWIGEELCMSYHHQYGVPSTVFRFTTVIEPSEYLNEDGLPKQFVFSPIYNRYKNYTGNDPRRVRDRRHRQAPLGWGKRNLYSSATLMDDPTRSISPMSGILSKDWFSASKRMLLSVKNLPSVEMVFSNMKRVVPYLCERYQMDSVDVQLPQSLYFEFDLSKIKTLLDYEPQHDLASILDARRSNETG